MGAAHQCSVTSWVLQLSVGNCQKVTFKLGCSLAWELENVGFGVVHASWNPSFSAGVCISFSNSYQSLYIERSGMTSMDIHRKCEHKWAGLPRPVSIPLDSLSELPYGIGWQGPNHVWTCVTQSNGRKIKIRTLSAWIRLAKVLEVKHPIKFSTTCWQCPGNI